MRRKLLILLIPLFSGGCQSPGPWVRAPQFMCYNRNFDDFLACKVARDVARHHLHSLYSSNCWPTGDFQAGFEQAYADVALGANGEVPAVAPSPYWKSCQRTVAGHQRAQEWLSGYSVGTSQALACRGTYNKVIANGSADLCPPQSVSGCGRGHSTLVANGG